MISKRFSESWVSNSISNKRDSNLWNWPNMRQLSIMMIVSINYWILYRTLRAYTFRIRELSLFMWLNIWCLKRWRRGLYLPKNSGLIIILGFRSICLGLRLNLFNFIWAIRSSILLKEVKNWPMYVYTLSSTNTK